MLKVGVFLLAVGLVFSGVYGMILTVSPATLTGSTLEVHGTSYEAAKETAAGQAFLVQTRHLGVMAMSVSIAMFFILFAAFSKGARWAWWAFLVAGSLGWVYGLIVQILEGDMVNTILHVIGIIILAFGLLLPLKVFFPKKA